MLLPLNGSTICVSFRANSTPRQRAKATRTHSPLCHNRELVGEKHLAKLLLPSVRQVHCSSMAPTLGASDEGATPCLCRHSLLLSNSLSLLRVALRVAVSWFSQTCVRDYNPRSSPVSDLDLGSCLSEGLLSIHQYRSLHSFLR